jgi:hypothetical protein
MRQPTDTLAELLKNVTINRFGFLLEAREPLRLPRFKGSTLRGAFGWAFKSICCSKPETNCAGCEFSQACIHSYVFETSPPEDSEMMRLYPAVPHPFVIEPPATHRETFASGSKIGVTLILIGRAREYLPYFVLAFREMGEIGLGRGRGKYSLQSVECADNQPIAPIYHHSSTTIHECPPPLSISALPGPTSASRISLAFETPTRVMFEGHLSSRPEFHILIRTLLRRISAISYFHCGMSLDLDYSLLVERSRQVTLAKYDICWHDWQRYSNRQRTAMKMGGFIGSASYEGPWQEFWPLIKLGELLHIGKGASFGLGKYSISTE